MCIVQSVTGHAGREERKTEAAALRHRGKQGGKEGGKGRRGEGFGERKNVIEKRERWEGWRETQSKSFKIAPQ